MRKGIALAATICLIGMGSTFADDPTDKPSNRAELRLGQDDPADGLVKVTVKGTDDVIYLHKDAVLTSKEIETAVVTKDSRGKPAIAIAFSVDGAKRIADVTKNNIDKRLAIVVDGIVISAPTIRSAIRSRAEISGNFTEKEAADIAKALGGKRF